jgi:hypothetical protein
MSAVHEKPQTPHNSLMEDLLDVVLSEPAVAWFLAQAVWVAQPVLETFWPGERIAAFAERLESPPGSQGTGARGVKDR